MTTKKTLSVTVGKDEIPKFNSEAEEAAWWDNNHDFALKKLQEKFSQRPTEVKKEVNKNAS